MKTRFTFNERARIMKNSKNRTANLMALMAFFLALILSLTACGSNGRNRDSNRDHSAISSTESSGLNENTWTEPAGAGDTSAAEQAAVLTLADAQAKITCKNERCVAIAYYGPENVRLSPYQDGATGVWPFAKYKRDLSGGWKVAYMFRILDRGDSPFSPEELEGLGLMVEDEMSEDASVAFENLEPMSEAEMRAIGIPFLDGHKCLISSQTSVGSKNFHMIVVFQWIDEMREADTEGLAERVSFFAGDGTPLDNYFDGYTLESTLDTNITFSISLEFYSSDSNEEQNETMIDELNASNPYMVYTGLDGEIVKTNLSWE